MIKFENILDTSSKKFHCPSCNKKTFVKFINSDTKEYLNDVYGRCDRESKCGYFKAPNSVKDKRSVTFKSLLRYSRKSFKAIDLNDKIHYIPIEYIQDIIGTNCTIPEWLIKENDISLVQTIQESKEQTYIPFDVLEDTFLEYEKNTFIQNLLKKYNTEDVSDVIEKYFLGTIKEGYLSTGITFPYIDKDLNVRAVQVKTFDENNHTNGNGFLHSILTNEYKSKSEVIPSWLEAYNNNEKKVSCLFGEHLLKMYPINKIALVEAPKTAIYGTLHFGSPEDPENLLWIAVFNKSSFKYDKLKALEGRTIIVFPDLSKDSVTFNEWKSKAEAYESKMIGTKFIFSDYLEHIATDNQKKEGLDLADFLDKIEAPKKANNVDNVENVAISKISEIKKDDTQDVDNVDNVSVFKTFKKENKLCWDDDIKELKEFFKVAKIKPIKLNNYTKILNPEKFINRSMGFVEANNGNKTYLPYLNRLKEYKNKLNQLN